MIHRFSLEFSYIWHGYSLRGAVRRSVCCFGESEMLMLLKTDTPSGLLSTVRRYLGLLSQDRQWRALLYLRARISRCNYTSHSYSCDQKWEFLNDHRCVQKYLCFWDTPHLWLMGRSNGRFTNKCEMNEVKLHARICLRYGWSHHCATHSVSLRPCWICVFTPSHISQAA